MKLLTIVMTLVAAASCSAPGTSSTTPYAIAPGDSAAVLAALQDYVDGFTLGRPELLERSLSPGLVKKGFRRTDPAQPYGDAIPLSFENALALAKRRGGQAAASPAAETSVELFEVADKTASGKVTASWGIDYVHLVKEDNGRWRIHHVIWQTEPARAGD